MAWRLPNGEMTSDRAVYLQVWQRMADPVAALTGWTVRGFDPDFVFGSLDGAQNVTLSAQFVEALLEGLRKRGANKGAAHLPLKMPALRTIKCEVCGTLVHTLGRGRPKRFCPECLLVRKKLQE